MNKANIKCPRCHSNKLYKFGLDKQANQKYQCKKCKRQFAPNSVSNPIIVKHHTTNIDIASNELVSGSLSMKGMRFPLYVILTTLTL